MALQGRAKDRSKSGKAYPQGLYTALKTANHFKTNFFPHEKKIITHLFSFSHPNYFFFLFFGCWVGQPAQAKDIAKNISRNVPPNAQKRGKLFVYLGTTYSPPFSGKSS